jgi:predicted Zn-dependent protease
MHRCASPCLALSLALLAGGCTSVNPATGRREVVLMSTRDEQRIDAEQSQEVEARLGLVRDPELVAYVDAIGQAMAAHSPRRDVTYHFQVVEMEEPNAFALPGGHIYVSRSLLTFVNSEAELAMVLGHEIGHVAARHAAQQDAHVKTLGLASVLSDLMNGGAPENPESENISGSFVARYARNQEREADRIGLDLATAAGVDPSGLGRFLQTLDQLSRLQQGYSAPQSYLSDHPATQERMVEMATRAQEAEWRSKVPPLREWQPGRPVATSREQFLAHFDGLAVGRPASEGVFDEDRFMHPDLGFLVQFPSGWKLLNLSDQVVGIAPKRDAVVLLQLDSEGDDPVEAARAYALREHLPVDSGAPLRIGGLPAYRLRALVPTGFGRIPAEITWIALDGRVYRLIGGVQPGTLRNYEGVFRKFAHGFRQLTPEDRARITELRLRIARVQPGESLATLSARMHNEWDLAYTAVANGMAPGAQLEPGAVIKVAVREPYAAKPKGEKPSQVSPPTATAQPPSVPPPAPPRAPRERAGPRRGPRRGWSRRSRQRRGCPRGSDRG